MRILGKEVRRIITIATLVFVLVSTAIIWGTYNEYLDLIDTPVSQMEEQEEAVAVSLFKRIPIPEFNQ